MNPLPKLQILSLYQINIEKTKIPSIKGATSPFESLPAIIEDYNKGLEESNRYKEIEIDADKWNHLTICGFQIKWWISVRKQKLSGASISLQSLAKNQPQQFEEKQVELGTSTEHHLIFLFRESKRIKTEATASKAQQIWEIFALTTNDGNYPIRHVADFSFPLKLARRICMPAILNENKIPIGGDYLTVGGEFKQEHLIAYSSLESLSQITKIFQSALKPTCSLYQAEPFKQFVHQQGEEKTSDRVKVSVGEMYIRFNRSFSLEEHAQICDQISNILDFSNSKDPEDEAFEYFDHIRRIPSENVSLVEELETAMIKKVFYAFYQQTPASFEFYHHHYRDYANSTIYRMRNKGAKTALASWSIRPSAEEILKILRHHLKAKNLVEFMNGIKRLVFDFHTPEKKRASVYPLLEFFKGEVFFKGRQYFYLDGCWCEVEGEYYSFIQNEFLKKMGSVFLKSGTQGALPLAWVSKKEWTYFSLEDLRQGYDQKEWKSIAKELLDATIDSKKNGKEIFIQKVKNSKYIVSSDPNCLPEGLKIKLGDAWLNMLSRYYARQCNYCEKEEDYNRKYLFNTYNQGKFFGIDQGYLVFDQVYPSEQQKIELFDVAYYCATDLFLYHIKEQVGQKTRDACSQIRTAAEAIAKSREIGGKSNVLSLLFDRAVADTSKSEFQNNVRQQLLAFGKNQDEAKAAFLKIFQRNKSEITFVYAFLDDGIHERDLGKELERSYPIASEDFDNECTQYQGEKTLTGEQILFFLQKEGYLDVHCRMTDAFIALNKADDFVPKFLERAKKQGYRKKNRDAIFQVLQSHLSQFHSFIAKKELLDTKRYIEGLGFHFRICQIYRDRTPSNQFHFEPTVALEIPKDLITNWKDVIEIDQKGYLIRKTAGGGSCALHALNGEDVEGVITFCHSEENPHLAAKQDFINKLDDAIENENTKIRQRLTFLFATLLKEYWGGVDHPEPALLFKTIKLNLEASKRERDAKSQRKIDLENKRAEDFWNYFKHLKHQSWKKKYLSILKSYRKDDWKDLEKEQLIEKIEENLLNVINGCWNNLYKIMGENGKKNLDPLQQEINSLNDEIGNWEMQYVTDNFKSIWKQYQKALTDSRYYLSELEIEIAAIIYDKKNVRIVTRLDDYSVISAHKSCYNPEEGLDELVIYHEDNHYSQCQVNN